MDLILVKNTFLHYAEAVEAKRPRTESCDAIVMGRTKPLIDHATYTFPVVLEEEELPEVEVEEVTGMAQTDVSEPEVPVVKVPHHLSNVELFPEISEARDLALETLSDGEEMKTTVMLRNIPNKYSQQMLLDVMDARGFHGLYDFFYLPIDFRNKCNVGYAFVNLIHPHYALLFKKAFHNFKLSAFKSQKVCQVSWGRVQGVDANVDHYRNSAIMTVAFPEYKPKIFRRGVEVEFPTADGPLPHVKLRPSKQTGGDRHSDKDGHHRERKGSNSNQSSNKGSHH